jgi:hypothetical protein
LRRKSTGRFQELLPYLDAYFQENVIIDLLRSSEQFHLFASFSGFLDDGLKVTMSILDINYK